MIHYTVYFLTKMLSKLLIVITVHLTQVVLFDFANPCEKFELGHGCKCFPLDFQVRCEDGNLTPTGLSAVGTSLKLNPFNYELLYINNTSIDKIEAGTFTNETQFTRIFIANNNKLTDIVSNAFNSISTTVSIFITNNSLLENINNLLESSVKLQNLDLSGNNLQSSPKFNDNITFKNTHYIRLDRQASNFSIPPNTISKLPSLIQLSLDNPYLKLEKGSISLEETKTNSTVSVFITSSNLEKWDDSYLISTKNINVYLDLIDNPLSEPEKLDLSQFKPFLNLNRMNKIFLTNKNTTCNCTQVKIMKELNDGDEVRVNYLHCTNSCP